MVSSFLCVSIVDEVLELIRLLGVGAGLSPPKYLVPGTQMDVSIGGIGTLRNNVVFADE